MSLNMSNKRAILGLMAMSLMMSGSSSGIEYLPPDKREPSPPKGLTKFDIDGKEIWALNLKNAIRKSKKL
jgi:hypothetical protein